MNCEMCGKPATGKATVEGVQMAVCASCMRYGTNARPLPQAAPKKGKPSASSSMFSERPREELIETVRPDFPKLLRQHREKLKLNQGQFAASLQVRASTYNHWESGAAVPDTATARKLEHTLGVPLVVHMKLQSGAAQQQDGEVRGLQLGDFIKKK